MQDKNIAIYSLFNLISHGANKRYRDMDVANFGSAIQMDRMIP